jgi:hypothetical protein
MTYLIIIIDNFGEWIAGRTSELLDDIHALVSFVCFGKEIVLVCEKRPWEAATGTNDSIPPLQRKMVCFTYTSGWNIDGNKTPCALWIVPMTDGGGGGEGVNDKRVAWCPWRFILFSLSFSFIQQTGKPFLPCFIPFITIHIEIQAITGMQATSKQPQVASAIKQQAERSKQNEWCARMNAWLLCL